MLTDIRICLYNYVIYWFLIDQPTYIPGDTRVRSIKSKPCVFYLHMRYFRDQNPSVLSSCRLISNIKSHTTHIHQSCKGKGHCSSDTEASKQIQARSTADRSSFECFARIICSFLLPADVELCMTP